MKISLRSFFSLLAILPSAAFASNSVVNMSHYDMIRPDFVRMKNEGVVAVIHEATFPRLNRDWKYPDRQYAAINAGLLWGAYHFGDGTNPISQADHFLSMVQSYRPPIKPNDAAEQRNGVLLVLDFEKNGHYPGGSMTVGQAVQFVQRIKERTGKYPGIYGSEYRLRQMLYGSGTAAQRAVLANCWLWIANYHAVPRSTA
ncbi:MAG TPA: glycoside hydrolase family 25 protein, partial [Chthoniobacterales bacterium]|nr:glycoside hydrolase family 25 protein [Chthoniobacterales bacterium]